MWYNGHVRALGLVKWLIQVRRTEDFILVSLNQGETELWME